MKPSNPLKISLLILVMLVVSWILVHVLALLGVFLALAIPILNYANYPQITWCLWCRLHEPPHHLWHSFINMAIILVATAVSLALVFAETKVLSYFGVPSGKTVQFVIPTKNEYKVGEIFPLKIELKGIKVAINVIRTDLEFDPQILKAVNVSTDGSFANLFVQKDINNQLGYVRLTGGVPNPGYHESEGMFGTVFFEALKPGPTQVEFLPTSMVLANDGQGSNVLLNLPSATYVISTQKLSADDYNLQQKLMQASGPVLGEATDRAQIVVSGYDEAPPLTGRVLGEATSSSPGIFATLTHWLSSLDDGIISVWRHLVSDALFKVQ